MLVFIVLSDFFDLGCSRIAAFFHDPTQNYSDIFYNWNGAVGTSLATTSKNFSANSIESAT